MVFKFSYFGSRVLENCTIFSESLWCSQAQFLLVLKIYKTVSAVTRVQKPARTYPHKKIYETAGVDVLSQVYYY
jgi:hypothetical protein